MSKPEKKLSQKWCVASFFDDLPAGFEFAMEEVPLHATLAGVCALPMSGDEIARNLKSAVAHTVPFEIYGDTQEQWGEGLKVTLIRQSNNFDNLLRLVQATLLEEGAVFNEPQYLGDGFTSHITMQKSGEVLPGESRLISSVSLVDMFPDEDGYRRRIHAVVRFQDGE